MLAHFCCILSLHRPLQDERLRPPPEKLPNKIFDKTKMPSACQNVTSEIPVTGTSTLFHNHITINPKTKMAIGPMMNMSRKILAARFLRYILYVLMFNNKFIKLFQSFSKVNNGVTFP